MYFAKPLTLFSLVVSALATDFILALYPDADVEDFSQKLEDDGITVTMKLALVNVLVVNTDDHDITALEKYPEVLSAEEDQIVSISHLPSETKPAPVETPFPLPGWT